MALSLLQKHILVVDNGTTEESLKHELFGADHGNDFDDTFLKDVDLVDFGLHSHKDVVLVLLERIEAKDDLVENPVLLTKVLQEGNLLEGHANKFGIRIIVLEDAFSNFLQNERVAQHDLLEV